MRFFNYINESRTKQIDANDAFLKITNNCSRNYKKMFNSIKSLKIYRGLDYDGDFGYVDSNKGRERVSANTENYYTLLFDNLPSWKGWPKRSRGIICTTNLSYTNNYGNSFYVIPYDNAKIGVCSSYDMWESIINPKFQKYFSSLNDFNYVINYLSPNSRPKNYNELKNLLIKISKYDLDSYKREKHHYFFNQKDIIKHLNDILDPKKNGFEMGIENLKYNKEIWIQGEVILLSNNGYGMMVEDLYDYFWGSK